MNTTIAPQQLVEQLTWRYATKQFDPSRKINERDWAALEQALILAPSSCGLQPWHFIVVNDPALRARLKPASWGQSQITDAARLVVLASKTNLSEADVDAHLGRQVEVRGGAVEALKGYRDMMMGAIVNGMDATARAAWAKNQTFIALGYLLAAAAALGIDACPMEGFEPAKYDEILGLTPKGLTASVVATLGYRAATDKNAGLPKVRFPRERVLTEV